MFAFGQIEAKKHGSNEFNPVSFGSYLRASFEQGLHDSIFANIYRMEEFRIAGQYDDYDDTWRQAAREYYDQYPQHRAQGQYPERPRQSAILTPENATAQYGLPGLTFNDPINEEKARLLHDRHKAALRREYFLTQGHRSMLGKGVGFGVSMFASMLNPIDFASAFIPITKVGTGANILGRGAYKSAIRRALNEGFIDVGKRLPVLTGSVINNAIFQTAAEIPRFAEQQQIGQRNYGIRESMLNIAGGTAIGVGIHMGTLGALKIFQRMTQDTKVELLRKATNDFLEGKDTTDLHHIASLDRNVIKEHILFDEAQALRRAKLKLEPHKERIVKRILKDYAPEARSIQDWKDLARENVKPGKGFNDVTDAVARKIEDPGELHNALRASKEIKEEYQAVQAKISQLREGGVKFSDPVSMTQYPEVKTVEDLFNLGSKLQAQAQFLREVFEFATKSGSQEKFTGDFEPRFTPEGILKPEHMATRTSQLLEDPEIKQRIDAEFDRRVKAVVDHERRKFEKEKRRKQNHGEDAKAPERGAEPVKEAAKPTALAEQHRTERAKVEAEIDAIGKEVLAQDAKEVATLAEKIDKTLESMKVDMRGTMQAFGLLPATWNAVIDMIRLAVRAGVHIMSLRERVMQTIQEHQKDISMVDVSKAVDYLQDRLNGMVTETDVQLAKEKPFGIAQAKDGTMKVESLLKKIETLPLPERQFLQSLLGSFPQGERISVKDLKDSWFMNRPQIIVEEAFSLPERSMGFYERKSASIMHELETRGYLFDMPGDASVLEIERPESIEKFGHKGYLIFGDSGFDAYKEDLKRIAGEFWERDQELLKDLVNTHRDFVNSETHQNIGGAGAGVRDYNQSNLAVPKDFKEMVGPVTIKVHHPKAKIDRKHFGRPEGHPDYPTLTTHFEGTVASWARGYFEIRDDKRIFHIFEQQSDWAQAYEKSEWETVVKQDPIIAYTTHLAIKAAIGHAKRNGATHIAISTGDSAMWAEGHWLQAIEEHEYFGPRYEEMVTDMRDQGIRSVPGGFEVTFGAEARFFETREAAEAFYNNPKDFYRKEPRQAPGMYQHYDATLPSLVQALTKASPEPELVNFGQQYNVGLPRIADQLGPIPKNVPPPDITARVFPLDKVPEDPVFSMFQNKLEQGLTALDQEMISNVPKFDEAVFTEALRCAINKLL